ncbi:MAG: 2-hydroxyglutaryl-CoA dehydratase [Tepidanaerobacter acetatoxydans]|uniref:CoA-substrate-specific enzyme activase n=1 Tax=Tepidanaerobacter acetatoxydans (strain DSM 21804 / JCM 16047 / Re1) TaxID=1209989 RepID=F4LU51_TEPAE|nr:MULTISPECIES: acyl-CoA dehydratase activase [Tepidanaerobacter]AEE90577.1 CoA-substrate-specific enzyme activase [Tepidanaerobacter acetatoxydans Re1]NLU11354.1 2-hydroxyglutaryl-CoA dehydratase [Tepidanaerobacter acetatoxydans]CCP25092.1 CoA-substrate-specific enzyme activase [Tepidanaerobacter acetatoxydans Re1]
MSHYLGVDVGSVSTNLVLIDEDGFLEEAIYIRTQGNPIKAVQEGMEQLSFRNKGKWNVKGVGATGSGRQLAGVIVGADVIKNEITAHAVAALREVPDVQTVLEIGGQDSKIIILRDGVVTDFAMNTVCAAGTGSFLDQQANRLNIPIEEFGDYALKSESPVRIAGRCAVFAESDMVHKQQLGYKTQDIIRGLCEALVRNYLNNIAKGKEIRPRIVFQGGVAANTGMKAAFEDALEEEIYIPKHYDVMGAIGAALLAKDAEISKTRFKGFGLSNIEFTADSFECSGCPNHCEVVNIKMEGKVIARWGDRCNKWKIVDNGVA